MQASIPEAARFGAVTDSDHLNEAAGLKASKHLRVGHVMCGGIQEAHLFNNQNFRAHPCNAGLRDTRQHPGGQAGASDSMRKAAFGCGINYHESVAQRSFGDGALDVADCSVMACDVTGPVGRARCLVWDYGECHLG